METKVALYTVAFDPGDLRMHDSSFSKYCKELCEYRIKHECSFQCNEDGEYGRLLYIWEQQGYLMTFFSNHKDKLDTNRYGHINVQEAIRRHAILLYEIRRRLATGDLEDFFVPCIRIPIRR